MGFSLGWVAVRGSDPESICRILGLHETGVREELPESPMVGASLPHGWYLVVVDRGEKLLEDTLLQRLSADCEAVGCFVEEHVMYSAAEGWTNGRRVWSVTHDSSKARAHLELEGDLPPALSAIRARLESEQEAAGGDTADVDYLFDVPVELAKAVTGFRHDEDVGGTEPPLFEVLASDAAADSKNREPPAWWKKLFGA